MHKYLVNLTIWFLSFHSSIQQRKKSLLLSHPIKTAKLLFEDKLFQILRQEQRLANVTIDIHLPISGQRFRQ